MRAVSTLLLMLVAVAPAAAQPPVTEPNVMAARLSAYRAAVLPGGPGKDGIPSIDRPKFWSAEQAQAFLRPDDRVIGLYRAGVARAYPQRILAWHEIVNDVISDQPVSITYCPLTGTALGFRRGDTEFGVSGRLLNSNLVMYDRATDSEYSQVLGAGISGPMAGQGLDELRVVFTDWAGWHARHPGTQVLSTDTGRLRNYQRDPYGSYNPRGGYYASGSGRMFPVLHESDRYPDKREILGFRDRHGAVAVDLDTLRDHRVIERELNGESYVIIHDPVLDTGWVYRGDAEIDPAAVTLGPGGPEFPGRERLRPVNAFRAMWFAWAAFYPDTQVIDDAAAAR